MRSFLLLVGLWLLGLAPPATAQSAGAASEAASGADRDSTLQDALDNRRSGQTNLGLQAGNTGGLTMKRYMPGLVAYDASLLTDGDEYIRLLVFRVWERPLADSPMAAYVGPGFLVGAEAPNQSRLQPGVGVGGIAGLNFYAARFEVFLQVTPRVRFLPNREDVLGASVGLRYAL